MLNIDIAQLTRDALKEAGCNESIIRSFDGHSPIALDFEDDISILTQQVEENIWLWSRFAEGNEVYLSQYAEKLLQLLMREFPASATGQLQLTNNEGYLELRCMVNRDWLNDGKHFAEAMDQFYSVLRDISGLDK